MEYLAFYLNDRTYREIVFSDIIKYSFDELENNHNFIQYLFPTKQPSMICSVPELTDDVIKLFISNKSSMRRLKRAFMRMLEFYGFIYKNGWIELSDNFHERAKNWLHPHNHNFLRITRILQSLGLFGLRRYGRLFFIALTTVYTEYPKIVGNSKLYWIEAYKKFL